MLLPQQLWWTISGQLSFADTGILPIAAFLLFRSKPKWQWSVIDFLVIGYVAITALAEGMNKGYKLGAQNLALQELFSILLPYFVARHMFRHPQFAVDAAKRIVVSLVIVAILSVYEFRMGLTCSHGPSTGFSPSLRGDTWRLYEDGRTLRPCSRTWSHDGVWFSICAMAGVERHLE